MPIPAWDDVDQFIDPDDFGVPVTVRLQNGTVRTFPGIFDEPYLNTHIGEYEVDTRLPRVHCLEKYVLGVTRGDRCDVDGKKFDILAAPHADGTGFAVLELAPAELKSKP